MLDYLKACAVVSKLSDPVQCKVHNFFANGVVASCKVVGSILLATDELFRVEQLAIHSSTNFIHNCWLDHNSRRKSVQQKGNDMLTLLAKGF